jgi:hypothetical protein
MALARVVYTQSVAGNKNFTVPFPYISRDHVKVTVNGAPASFTWINTNTVQIDPAPEVGAKVEIRRVTERRNLLVDFNDGSTITETDLDLLALQNFYLSQEADDLAEESNGIANYAASTANNAISIANEASSNAASAVATANTALANSETAISTANTALTRAASAEDAAVSASNAAQSAATSADTAVTTAQQLETQFNDLLVSVEQIAGADLSDFAKNSDNLAFLTDKAAARANLGLGNVDNTSDLDKPVSLATQAALATKADVGHTHTKADITDLATANVATATRLQTARTITIGKTSKRFDGSANVSWSLAEIGAAMFGRLADGADLNTVINPGFYRLHTNHGNVPPYVSYGQSVSYGQLIVARGGGDTILQIVTGYRNGEIYWRQGNPPDVGGPGSWSAWYRFFHSGNLGAATESSAGIVKLATAAEAQAGTDGTKALSPLRLRDALNASGSAPIYACRAWVNFNGTDTVAIRASGNVSSITDNGTGDYTVNFMTAMPDVNYSAVFSSSGANGPTNPCIYSTTQAGVPALMSTTQVRIRCDNGSSRFDKYVVTCAVFR